MAAGNARTNDFPKTETGQSMSIGIEEASVVANDISIKAVPTRPELSGYVSPEEGLEVLNDLLDDAEPTNGIEEGSVAVNDAPINAVSEARPELSGYLTPEEEFEQADGLLDATELTEAVPATTEGATGHTGGELSVASVATPVTVGSVAALIADVENSSASALQEEASAPGLEEPLQSAACESVAAAFVHASEAAAPSVNKMVSADTLEALEDTAAAAPIVLEKTKTVVSEVPEVERMGQGKATVKDADIGDTVEVSVVDKVGCEGRGRTARCFRSNVGFSPPRVKWLRSKVFGAAGLGFNMVS